MSDTSAPIRNVVFVCEHGAAKSVLAASYFNHLAARHGLDVTATARGTHPGAEVSERVRADVVESGLNLCTTRPAPLTEADVGDADIMIAFDVTPVWRSATQRVAWNRLPLLSVDFDRGKAAIIAHVEALVEELRRQSGR